MYSRIIWLVAILAGLIYSAGYLSVDIREVMGKHVPMFHGPVGILLLFCMGATLGMSLAATVAPRAFLDSEDGQEFMREAAGSKTKLGFRLKACAVAMFVALATVCIVLTALN